MKKRPWWRKKGKQQSHRQNSGARGQETNAPRCCHPKDGDDEPKEEGEQERKDRNGREKERRKVKVVKRRKVKVVKRKSAEKGRNQQKRWSIQWGGRRRTPRRNQIGS